MEMKKSLVVGLAAVSLVPDLFAFNPIEASWRRDPVRDEIVCRLVVPCGTVAEVPRIGKTFGFGAREFKLPTESNVREGKSVW